MLGSGKHVLGVVRISQDEVRAGTFPDSLVDDPLQQNTRIPDPHGTQDCNKYNLLEILGVGRDEYSSILVSYFCNLVYPTLFFNL